MICPNCKNETNRIKSCGSGKWWCSNCIEKYDWDNPNRMDGIIMCRGGRGFGSRGKRTAAHDNDITHRRVTPQGESYMDYGKKSFTVNWK